ncbi:MAG TPA: hypothetical protein PK668_21500 [Myxococcota bacterium]|nr:hypothetical protein [Myxococcota bacterium]HRY96053.1 hypothetical protein [Myxococcota bacterium]HSA23789.1 hypothetical protein [Myxococcota bacterium]
MRTRLFSALALILVVLVAVPALAGGKVEQKDKESWYVTVDKVPTTLEECTALRDELCTTPQGAMVYYVVAQLVVIANPDVGERCMVIGMDMSQLDETIKMLPKARRPDVKGYQIGASEWQKMATTGFVKDAKYTANSYVLGTDYKNGYKLPELPYKYYVSDHKIQKTGGLSGEWDNTWHGFLATSCQDGGKVPFFVKKNDKGIWKMFQSSSFYAGCKDPPEAKSDDL